MTARLKASVRGEIMKRLITAACFLLLACNTLLAHIAIVGKKEMIQQSKLIALVDIQELVSTDKTKIYVDLLASGQVAKVLKGDAKGEIKFRIPRFFPCATFDVSTGRHLLFLEKNEKGEYVGVNWYMSYLYLGGKTAKWFGEKDVIIDNSTPKQVIEDTERELKKSPNK